MANQSLMRAQDVVPTTYLKEAPRVNHNKHANKQNWAPTAQAPTNFSPRYSGIGAADDWHGGVLGDDVGENDAAQAIVDANGTVSPDYEPRHQEEKAEILGLELAESVTKDYGPWGDLPGHGGPIGPLDPYPETP